MKLRYGILLAVLVVVGIGLECVVICSQLGEYPRLENAIQGAGVLVALIAAVIALSTADPKRGTVQVKISPAVEGRREHYHKDMENRIKAEYGAYPDPVISWQVHFNITNNSGFTLNRPTVSFRVPVQKKHPHREKEEEPWSRHTFNSNLYNSREGLRMLEFGDTSLLSNSNLPYWNNGDTIALWIRMVLDDERAEPFDVWVSVNCENADGCTQRILIDPKELLRPFKKEDVRESPHSPVA